jgi:glycosyltransferase involved in cell wall biosynthesis
MSSVHEEADGILTEKPDGVQRPNGRTCTLRMPEPAPRAWWPRRSPTGRPVRPAVDARSAGGDQRVRAVWVPNWYPDPVGPPRNAWARELGRAVAIKHQIVVLHAREGRLPDRADDRSDPPTLRLQYRQPRLLWVIPYLRAVLRGARGLHPRFPFQLVHAHCAFPAGLAGLFLAIRYGVPLVVTEHWGPYDQLMTSSRVNALALRTVVRRATTVAAVSSALKREMVQWTGRSDIEVIPPAADVALFRPESRLSGLDGGPVRLLFVGDLAHSRKRLEDVLEAVALLERPVRGRWVLDVVGDGELRPRYEEQAKSLGIKPAVRFHGALSLEGVAEAMRGCDVFVMPSTYETFGLVYAEALATGKPVVGTRCGGPEDFVTDALGRLVPIRDVPSLARALREVAAALATFAPSRLRSVVEERFSLDAVGERYDAVYRRLVG